MVGQERERRRADTLPAALLQALHQPPTRLGPFPRRPVWAGETASVSREPLGKGLPATEGPRRRGLVSDPSGLPGDRAELVPDRGWCIAFSRLLLFLIGRQSL